MATLGAPAEKAKICVQAVQMIIIVVIGLFWIRVLECACYSATHV
jgi:hypothetical protein